MKYTFTYRTRAVDLWFLSMNTMYRSLIGVCNIIFTAAMFLLAVRFWGEVSTVVRVLFVFAVCLFTVIQPVAIYLRAQKQVAVLPDQMEIGFDAQGIHVKTAKETSTLKWKDVKGAAKKAHMVVVFSSKNQGFLLPNKVLGNQRDAFYTYVNSMIPGSK